ncbi:MAG: diaminopimelate epimerase, partial [Candidatus Omnitrophica bacterium]|nr:diaminopimelate epimerase [Candidatus Omnitrophota bacterium]
MILRADQLSQIRIINGKNTEAFMEYDIQFTKCVASGNDFIVIDDTGGEGAARGRDYSGIARDVCRRRVSVGADGILVIEDSDKADFRMRVINPDGSEVDMCGNGARCCCYYASMTGRGEKMKFETGAGLLEAEVSGSMVRIRMSDPVDIKTGINLGIGKNMMIVHSLNTGVPHVVHLVDDLSGYDVRKMGKAIREHSMFQPEGTNVDFVGETSNGTAGIRTYERGVEDETLACGTGNVAAAVVLGLLGKADSPVELRTMGGDTLKVYFSLSGSKITDVFLEGPAKK